MINYLILVTLPISTHSRFHVAAHWWGFHDSHSGIYYYEWRVGSTPGAGDIIPTNIVHLRQMAFRFLINPLPSNDIIYITVRAYNKAGLWVEATSNGFMVDESPPEIIQSVSRVNDLGVIVVGSQVCSIYLCLHIYVVVLCVIFCVTMMVPWICEICVSDYKV